MPEYPNQSNPVLQPVADEVNFSVNHNPNGETIAIYVTPSNRKQRIESPVADSGCGNWFNSWFKFIRKNAD